ncbi:MAG: hypothetical protein NTY35_16230 [Planctomycetota bacterium]|nr:hypothetical protein [Planctomycetota bacterium]
MDGPSAIVFGILIPAVLAGIVLLVSARRARTKPDEPRPVAGALALGAGYLVAHGGLVGIPPLPGSGNTVPFLGWIFWTTAAAVVLSPLRVAPGVARFGNAFYVALFAILPYHWIRAPGVDTTVLSFSGFGGVLLAYGVWSALEKLSLRRPGPSLPLALWAACAGTAAMALGNSSASQAQLVGALAAGLGAAVVVALLVRGAHLASGAIAILAVVVASVVRLSVVYDLPTVCWVLVAVAFLGPWLGELPSLRARSPLLAGAVAFLAALLPAAAAAWLAFDARPPSPY